MAEIGEGKNSGGQLSNAGSIPAKHVDDLEQYKKEVRDARELLEYAISTGRSVDDSLVLKIKEAEESLDADKMPPPETRAKFEQAYRDLARFMAPVTVETLNATSDRRGRKFFWAFGPRVSPARWFSKELVSYALVALALILVAEGLRGALEHYFPADEQMSTGLRLWYLVAHVLERLKPSLYGLLGALSYLIRSAHDYYSNRTFDLQRRPEYYNRILLGTIAGSIALLFVDPATGTTKLGPNALAFLVGYNTDNLFNLIERLGATILSKGAADSAAGLATIAKLSLPPEVYGGLSVSGTVILNNVAPAAGVNVSFTSTGDITVPGKTSVPAGQKENSFTFVPDKPAATQVGTITASGNGTSATAPLTVYPPITRVDIVALNSPPHLQPNQENSMSVQLSDKVPFDSVSITLTTDIKGATLSPTVVKIDKGNDSGDFILTTQDATSGTIVATLFDTKFPTQF
jgi:hypothetical protein